MGCFTNIVNLAEGRLGWRSLFTLRYNGRSYQRKHLGISPVIISLHNVLSYISLHNVLSYISSIIIVRYTITLIIQKLTHWPLYSVHLSTFK